MLSSFHNLRAHTQIWSQKTDRSSSFSCSPQNLAWAVSCLNAWQQWFKWIMGRCTHFILTSRTFYTHTHLFIMDYILISKCFLRFLDAISLNTFLLVLCCSLDNQTHILWLWTRKIVLNTIILVVLVTNQCSRAVCFTLGSWQQANDSSSGDQTSHETLVCLISLFFLWNQISSFQFGVWEQRLL